MLRSSLSFNLLYIWTRFVYVKFRTFSCLFQHSFNVTFLTFFCQLKQILDGTLWAFLSLLLKHSVRVSFLTFLCLPWHAADGRKPCVARTQSDDLKPCLPAATLHRQPGLQQILGSIRLYRKECTVGIDKVPPSGALSLQCLQRLQWAGEKSQAARCWHRDLKKSSVDWPNVRITHGILQANVLHQQFWKCNILLFEATARHRVCA